MKRWFMAMVIVLLLLSAVCWPGDGCAAKENIVPTQLADKSALYNAKRRWGNEVRIYDMKTYVDLSGQPAAYVYTIYKKVGEAPSGSALSSRIAEARGKLQESQAKLDELNQQVRNKGKRFTAPAPAPEADASGSPADAVAFPVSAVLSPELMAAARQPSVRISAMEQKLDARRLAKRETAALRRELSQTDLFGTVVVGAHFGAMPFLEMFDGLALHYTMLEQADALAADTLGADNVERGDFDYLGPTFFVFEHVKDGRRVLTDPTIGQSRTRKWCGAAFPASRPPPRRTPPRPGSSLKSAWMPAAISWKGTSRLEAQRGRCAACLFITRTTTGRSCGPTASAQLLGYWDDHGYGNLIDNGRSNTGHEWQ